MSRTYLILIASSVLLAACTHIGPKTVPQDRFDYNSAVADSWKEQTLLNIVKLRYADMPVFLEVASIVSGYTLESSVNLGGTVSSEKAVQGDFVSLGAAGKYTDRPIITYAPITGSDFNKSFMTPVPPSGVLFMLQAGWPAEIILPLTLESINGLRASKSAGAGQRLGDTDYYRVIEIVQLLQRSRAIGMRVLGGESGDQTTVLVIRRNDVSPEVLAAQDELARLLGIRRGAQEYTVAYGEIAKSDTELAILTRSMLSMLIELAALVSVPEEDVAEGRTLPSLAETLAPDDIRRLITIEHSKEKPKDAFVSARYKDHWFSISDRDFESKRIFAYLMLLFSLTESGGKEGLPLVTIPAG